MDKKCVFGIGNVMHVQKTFEVTTIILLKLKIKCTIYFGYKNYICLKSKLMSCISGLEVEIQI